MRGKTRKQERARIREITASMRPPQNAGENMLTRLNAVSRTVLQ